MGKVGKSVHVIYVSSYQGIKWMMRTVKQKSDIIVLEWRDMPEV